MDILETVLQRFHFSKTVYCAYCTNYAPWGIGLGVSRNAQFHAVRSGKSWVRAIDQDFCLNEGDFIVLPHGHAHDVVDNQHTAAIPAPELLANVPWTNRWNVSLGKDGELCEIICAGFEYAGGIPDPILSFLPPVIHLHASETASLEPLLQLAEREMATPRHGAEAMLSRTAEMLMIESVRTFAKTLSPDDGGWLGALGDAKIAVVLGAIHRSPAKRWTLEELAAISNMSRTSLATRFRDLVGVSVQSYIRKIRLAFAISMLEDPNRPSLSRIAELSGYSSESSFSRAFKREIGVAPTDLPVDGRH